MSNHGKLIYTLADMPERGIYVFETLAESGQRNFPAIKILRQIWQPDVVPDNRTLVYVRYYKSEVEAITDFNWDPFSGNPYDGTAWFAYDEEDALDKANFFGGQLRLISDDTDGIAV